MRHAGTCPITGVLIGGGFDHSWWNLFSPKKTNLSNNKIKSLETNKIYFVNSLSNVSFIVSHWAIPIRPAWQRTWGNQKWTFHRFRKESRPTRNQYRVITIDGKTRRVAHDCEISYSPLYSALDSHHKIENARLSKFKQKDTIYLSRE